MNKFMSVILLVAVLGIAPSQQAFTRTYGKPCKVGTDCTSRSRTLDCTAEEQICRCVNPETMIYNDREDACLSTDGGLCSLSSKNEQGISCEEGLTCVQIPGETLLGKCTALTDDWLVDWEQEEILEGTNDDSSADADTTSSSSDQTDEPGDGSASTADPGDGSVSTADPGNPGDGSVSTADPGNPGDGSVSTADPGNPGDGSVSTADPGNPGGSTTPVPSTDSTTPDSSSSVVASLILLICAQIVLFL